MPVGKNGQQPEKPTVVISPWVLVAAIVFLAGDFLLPGWLGLDIACTGQRLPTRAAPGEVLACSLGQPPWGWFYLLWFFGPIMALAWYIRRSLRGQTGKRG